MEFDCNLSFLKLLIATEMSEEAKKESSKKDVTGDESPKKRLLASADGVSVCEVHLLF